MMTSNITSITLETKKCRKLISVRRFSSKKKVAKEEVRESEEEHKIQEKARERERKAQVKKGGIPGQGLYRVINPSIRHGTCFMY